MIKVVWQKLCVKIIGFFYYIKSLFKNSWFNRVGFLSEGFYFLITMQKNNHNF